MNINSQSSLVDQGEIPNAAPELAITIVEASNRYEAPSRVDFFDLLMADLQIARHAVNDHVHADDEKMTHWTTLRGRGATLRPTPNFTKIGR